MTVSGGGVQEPGHHAPGRRRGWIDRRIDWQGIRRTLLDREVPSRLTWWHTLGSATLTVFVVQVVTGIVLATYYAPSPDHAYESVQYIQRSVVAGSLLRAMHHWGASAMVVLVLAHMVRVFSMGAYKYPREINWVLGVGLFLLVMAFGFTGYLLPWDQRAYWATQVGTNIAGTAPFIGDFAARLLKAGTQLGAATLTRFYAFHVLWLPALLGAVVLLHLSLVIRQGIAPPPAMLEDGAPRSTGDATYEHYYDQAYDASKRGGARFWPDVVAKDVATSLIVVTALVLLALAFGAPLEPPADPTDTAYVPRPEWYFLPFFQLLKLFPGSMESTIAVGVPLLLVLALLGLPFFDRGSHRNLLRRPAALAAFSLVMITAATLLGMAVRDVQPDVAPETGRLLSSTERAGRAMFRSRCATCHVVGNQEGGSDGPELTDIGSKHGAEWLHSYVENPKRFHPDAKMSPFGPPVLSHQEIEEVARYLSTLRGPPGHEVPPVFRDTFPGVDSARPPTSRTRP
ncbi:MAG: cytochrome b N-terminal domain-containing protein [Gemmatimonadota bacterium]|nr:cytochrome b N-terminal domain-containing protein [Gemmatimonadota bacterium]